MGVIHDENGNQQPADLKKSTAMHRCNNQLPIDKGWAWVVIFASSGIFCILAGTYKCTGIIKLEIHSEFPEASQDMMLWVFSLFSIVSFLVGPPVSVLMTRTSNRLVGMIGGGCCSLGILASGFAPNSIFLFFSIGCMYGVGCGALSLVCFTSFAPYFKRHKALAVGIMAAGSGVGSIICPKLLQHLFDTYSYTGALLCYSGFYMQTIILSCLLRPMSYYTPESRPDIMEDHQKEPLLGDVSLTEEQLFSSISETSSAQNEKPSRRASFSDSYEREDEQDCDKSTAIQRLHCSTPAHLDSAELELPRNTPSKYYNGINNHINHNLSTSVTVPVGSTLTINMQEKIECRKRSKPKPEYNWKLWYNPKVILIGMLMLLAVSGVNIIFTTAPTYGTSEGVEKDTITTIMSVAGTAEMLFRIFNGWFADQRLVPAITQFAFFTGAAGIASILCALLPGQAGMMIIYGTMSLFGTSVFSLIPIVTIELVGVENLPAVTGISGVYQATAFVLGTFAANNLYGIHQSWPPVYYFVGATYLLGTTLAVLYTLPSCKMWRHVKSEKQSASV